MIIRLLLVVLLLLGAFGAMAQETDDNTSSVVLVPVEVRDFQFISLVPQGWNPLAQGVYYREATPTDTTAFIQQGAPFPVQLLVDSFLAQLQLDALPVEAQTRTTATLTWDVYSFEANVPGTGSIQIDLATAAAGDMSYITILQANPGAYEALHRDLFLPAVDALAPMNRTEMPPYVDQDAFTETEVTVGAEGWATPGTLTMPVDAAGVPAVVLVHGSGPSDRDLTVGPNKMFRDLAFGLASQGIAVLRYDKRTLTHRSNPALALEVNIDAETTDDALAAVDFLRDVAGVDADQIYVIGLSLGATLAPRIAEQSEHVAGIVMMAGMARTFEATLADQAAYQRELAGANLTEQADATLQSLEDTAAAIAALRAGEDAETAFEGVTSGAPPAYWQSIVDYDQIATAQALDVPILVLQGERDYQVTMEDFGLWQAALADNDNVTFISYPDLIHIFMPLGELESLSVPADNFRAGFVPENVIDDLVNWLNDPS